MQPLDIFLVCPPGLEPPLHAEATDAGFKVTEVIPGGVTITGGWPEVWRANLTLRGAVRVLVRVASFRAMHPAQLDKRARKLPWGDWLKPGVPVRVEASCKKSRIYHAGAASDRIGKAISDIAQAPVSKDADIAVKVRIFDDLCTISLDSSGAALHQRGLKQQVNAAPMRETMAAMLLRAAGWDGNMPVYDPMCGSGTFPIEAAEIASGLQPGRARKFAFEDFAGFDPQAFAALRHGATATPDPVFYGSDRDQGAVGMSVQNAERSGVADLCHFRRASISDAEPPCAAPGLVIVNPPYGGRIGNRKTLFGLYGAFGAVMKTRFSGWRVAMATSDDGLAGAAGLPFDAPSDHIANGGIRIRLWQTPPLA